MQEDCVCAPHADTFIEVAEDCPAVRAEVPDVHLETIDRHVWDWTLWLTSKQAAGKSDLVTAQLRQLFDHLLAPLGAEQPPVSIEDAIDAYRTARKQAEDRFDVRVPRRIETEVVSSLARPRSRQ